ncbi:MAG: hypothetical protein ACKN97_08650 [Acidobacteriota bacterium]
MKSGEAGRPAAVKDTFKTLERATEGKVSADVSKAIVFLVEKYLVLTSESFEAARGLTAPFLSPVFEVGGHSKPEIGSTCLARRNRRIIETHRLLALESLAKLLKESVSDGVRIDINSALRTLIESFRDEAGLEVLNSFETESKHLAITRPAVSTVLRAESA